MNGQYLQNVNAPVLDVKHSTLKRWSDNSVYKSVCPVCREGVLLVGRDQRTHELLELDRCVLCGQPVRYVDIEELRRRERG